MLSRRLPPHADTNALSRAIAARRAAGRTIVDLTESNPTHAGFRYPPDLLRPLASEAALHYEPHPFGLASAREAIARDHARRGIAIDPDQVVLAASTSEAYTWLFKLLCNPGEAVLVPRPSYPLFEHLTALEGVRSVPFSLEYHGRWEIDFATLEDAPPDTRALIIVSPNNPTGSYVSAREAERLFATCRERGWTLIADEVFADYPLEVAAPLTDLAFHADVLAFSLGGLSKGVGLPQLKLAWLVAGGPPESRAPALTGLELIADSFLSVSTPVQIATPTLLECGAAIRTQIHQRVRDNLAMLRELAQPFPACGVLKVEGGWSAVIRVPATRTEDQLILGLLDAEGIIVHPGYFFDFAREAFVVMSLLPPTETLREGALRLLRYVAS
jgi:aspartate/methionine/tyrosine aminotransferase